MRNKKESASDEIIPLAKVQLDTLMENLANLETSIKTIQEELCSLQQQKLATEERANNEGIHLKEQRYFILPNIEKKNEEAIYDAVNFFKKKCPYCDTNLYEGHPRKKMEIDHYIPISKGGQDVPWNILPVCRNCNNAKRNKLPEVFLDAARRQYCDDYLVTIRKRLVDEIQTQIEQYQQVKNYLMAYQEKILSLQKADLRDVLVNLAKLLNIDSKIPELITNEDTLAGFIKAYCDPPEKTTQHTRARFKELYDAFSGWLLKTCGDYPPRKKEFSLLMEKRFRREKVGGHIWFYGVGLRPKAERQ